MTQTVEYFPTPVVLTVVHGKLLCEIGEVYRVMNFLSGDNLFTHQLPRAHRILAPWVLEQHPQLSQWDESQINHENWQEYVQLAITRFGATLPLTPIPAERWTHINAIEEARAMMGDDKVIVMEQDDL